MNTPAAGGALPPLASTQERPARSGAGNDARAQLAWQREMERAQVARWFTTQHQAPGVGRDASAVRPTDNAGPDQAGRHRGRAVAAAAAAPTFAAPAAPSTTALPQRVQPAPPFAAASLLQPGVFAALPAHAAAPEAAALETDTPIERRTPLAARTGVRAPAGERSFGHEADEAAAQPPVADAPEPQAPLRLHEEATPRGQALWIGMHADEQLLATLLPQLVHDLQQAQALHGRHLHQIVCNGRLVWRDGEFVVQDGLSAHPFIPDTTQEIPWPSTL